jgi:hypothetical protein
LEVVKKGKIYIQALCKNSNMSASMSRRKAIGTILAGLAMPGAFLEGCAHNTDTLERILESGINNLSQEETQEKHVPSVTIELDYLTSLLVSYHILCAPTEMNQKYNQEIFEELSSVISEEESEEYIEFLESQNFPSEKTDRYRSWLFFPNYDELNGLLQNNQKHRFSKEIVDSIKQFEPNYKRYWNVVISKLAPTMEKKRKELKGHVSRIYNLAEQKTGETIEKEKDIEIRVVHGLSPSSFVTTRKGKRYRVIQSQNYMEDTTENNEYLLNFVHELVPHVVAQKYKHLHEEIFGKWIYKIEEGFVKLMTRKICEELIGELITKRYGGGLEASYNIFERNWNQLNGNFGEWYKKCLLEIKREFNLGKK